MQKVARLPRKRRRAQGTPEGRQSVHHAPCRAKSRAPATQKARRLKERPEGRQSVHHAPFAKQKVARLSAPQKARDVRKGRPKGRPERTSRPFCVSRKSRACHCKRAVMYAQVATLRGTPERTSRPFCVSRKSRDFLLTQKARDAQVWTSRGTSRAYITPLLREQKVARLFATAKGA